MNLLCIAGFLGSGKTTVLLEIARAMTDEGWRVAVIENEIGEVGVDGDYVREQGLPVQELFGGCICCTLQRIRSTPWPCASSARDEVPEDLAGPAFFLASPDSDFMTCQTLLADGGCSMW